MKKIGTMAESSEERLVLLLGKFGILHLCRSPAIEMVNTAAKRGVVIQVLAQLDRRTIRFYENIDDSIEIRHSDDVSALGVLRDNCEVIQYLYVDENPVGKGRDESALLIESEEFADSHTNLVDAILSESVEFAVAEKRFSEERIVDPLKLTIGAGSFLDNFRQALGVEDKLPDEDTPFEPESFLASSREVNSARSFLQGGELQNLDILGIDLKQMLRQVGNRIGEELAFSLRGIDSHIEFLNEMMDWWEHAGLGDLSYEFDPLFQIKVGLTHPPTENPNDLPLWELDDGIIQGTLKNRYPKSGTVKIIRDEGSGESDDLWRYTLLIPEFE
jgi:predicted hydrocarbon binding protein